MSSVILSTIFRLNLPILSYYLGPVSPEGFAYIAEVLNQFWKIGKPQNMSKLNQKLCMIWALKLKRLGKGGQMYFF